MKGKIVFWVLAAHFFVLLWMGISKSEVMLPIKRDKVLVQTVTLAPKKAQPAPKKTVAKAAPPKPVKKTEPKKVVNQELLNKAKENIAKIHKSSDKGSVKQIATPKKVETPICEKPEVAVVNERNYFDELSGRLKLMLKLPEWGAIVVELTLGRSGQVQDLKIIRGESVENRRYVEKTLPGLKFPGFGENFGFAATHTFTITLENEI